MPGNVTIYPCGTHYSNADDTHYSNVNVTIYPCGTHYSNGNGTHYRNGNVTIPTNIPACLCMYVCKYIYIYIYIYISYMYILYIYIYISDKKYEEVLQKFVFLLIKTTKAIKSDYQ